MQTSNNIDIINKYSVNLETRTIYLCGDIAEHLVDRVIRHIDELERLSPTLPITLRINSTGGSVFDGMAVVDRIHQCKAPVIGVAYGSCMSMATVILAACPKRVSARHTTFLLHEGGQSLDGTPTDVARWSKYLAKLDDKVNDIYAAAMGLKRAQVKRLIRGDILWSAEEALRHGLVYEVVG